MIRDAATQRQVDAARPDTSTWLSANAGSGKTRVLTDRVARLLYLGVSPQNVLCLTYTKAAAAEMQNRLFSRLGAWSMSADEELVKALRALGIEGEIAMHDLRRARTLFAAAVETPGGLKIQTIHSFCAGLLRRFPLEAGISPLFREMEDRTSAHLKEALLDELSRGPHRTTVAEFLSHFSGADLAPMLAEILHNKSYFRKDLGPMDLARALGLPPHPMRTMACAIAFNGSEPHISQMLTEAFAATPGTYQSLAARIAALDLAAPDLSTLDALVTEFLDSKTGESKSHRFPQRNHTKAVAAVAPFADELHAWMDRVAAAQAFLWSIDAYEKSLALHRFARLFIESYDARKQELALLDFDDLIEKANLLLEDRRYADWVLFRLDGGLDHILVDEAQDTSPDQWAVIRNLTSEFAAGHGARDQNARTIFVVGDKKQSIYSFQGADPREFDRMQRHFDDVFAALDLRLQSTELLHSFRSSMAVLRVVDQTFAAMQGQALGSRVTHIPFNADLPGRVDLWPPITADGKDEPSAWYLPVDQVRASDPAVELANQIAAEIKRMIAQETLPVTDSNGRLARRPITEGDVLILVQRRSDLFEEIIRACKAANLKVAGADRLRVGAELAVKDIMSLLAFLALPEDDLSLATALKSPLFGWTEQQLFTLAHHRQSDEFLWAALRGDAEASATNAVLQDLLAQADFLRPYDLIAHILVKHDGRRRLIARLGAEAEDGIDALLSQAMVYETQEVPSLTGFLEWMGTDDVTIKRQMDNQGDSVRVMTVHGAKGLEAPIVFLPDSAKRKVNDRSDIFVINGVPVWKTLAEASGPAVRAAREAAKAIEQEERLRLLYVAMTRAEKWLIVCAAGDVGQGDESWHQMVAAAMHHAGSHDVTLGGRTIKRLAHSDWDGLPLIAIANAASIAPSIPNFAPIVAPERSAIFSPSDLGGAKVLPGETDTLELDTSLRRGTLVHLCLEHLPAAAPDMRQDLAERLLSSVPGLFDDVPAQAASLVRLVSDPQLSDVFEPTALSEVEMTATLGSLGQVRIHGVIDRLIVRDDAITAIDFKTNRLVPERSKDVPEGILRQMGAYREALVQIYPDRQIRLAILWTETGLLMALDDRDVSEALARVTLT